jgi:hypothetical protein
MASTMFDLPAAVRPDDGGHARRQLEDRTVHERLEAVQLDLLDPHPRPLRAVVRRPPLPKKFVNY